MKNMLLSAVLVIGVLEGIRGATYKQVFHGQGITSTAAIHCARECRKKHINCTEGFAVTLDGNCVALDSALNAIGTYVLSNKCMHTTIGTSCYHIPAQKMAVGRTEAVAACAVHGMHVWAPNTRQEQDDVMAYLDAHPELGSRTRMWIDLVNDDTWAYNGAPATWTNWRNGQPQRGVETITVMNVAMGGVWDDVPDDRSFDYICERD